MDRVRIYATTVEDETVRQVERMSNCEAYHDCFIRIMPDCHVGTSCTIGTVIEIANRIVPNTVGVDIGCGMLVVELEENDVDLQELDRVIHTQIPSGTEIHQVSVASFDLLQNLRCISAVDVDAANRAIGSLGGGNHFIELNEDKDGRKYLVIHSGSRNLGVRVCKYYQRKAIEWCQQNIVDVREVITTLKAQGREREISKVLSELKEHNEKMVDKELAYIEGSDLQNYLHDMDICQQYALLNRRTMAGIILKALSLHERRSFQTIHNYIDVEQKILRKGAVRASEGEFLIIPMNMRDGSLICRGKGNAEWLYSAPHGAGRLMSRSQAREKLSLIEFEQSMQGVYTTSVNESTIDEAPMVYKPMEEIITCIEPTVDVLGIIKPIYNFKASETSPSWK